LQAVFWSACLPQNNCTFLPSRSALFLIEFWTPNRVLEFFPHNLLVSRLVSVFSFCLPKACTCEFYRCLLLFGAPTSFGQSGLVLLILTSLPVRAGSTRPLLFFGSPCQFPPLHTTRERFVVAFFPILLTSLLPPGVSFWQHASLVPTFLLFPGPSRYPAQGECRHPSFIAYFVAFPPRAFVFFLIYSFLSSEDGLSW